MCDFVFYYNHDIREASFQVFRKVVEKRKDMTIIRHYDEFAIDIYVLLDDRHSRIIAFDWDNTVGADIEFFSQLMDAYLEQGFIPIICSLRGPEQENLDEMREKLNRTDIDIHLTDGIPKIKYMKRLGYRVNLWIDDFFPAICKQDNPLLLQNKIDYGK